MVCSTTHGAIFSLNLGAGVSFARWVIARDDLIAPATAIPAAMKKNKQWRTRNRKNAEVRFELAIIDAPAQLRLYPKPQEDCQHFCNVTRARSGATVSRLLLEIMAWAAAPDSGAASGSVVVVQKEAR